MTSPRLIGAAALAVAALVLAACGKADSGSDASGAAGTTPTRTVERTTRVEVVKGLGTGRAGGFDPEGIYRRESPGVVTVISIFEGGAPSPLGDENGGLGSGFVISDKGEIATNAHVVTDSSGGSRKRAKSVFVQFGDGNQVPAKIVGDDPNADVALLRIDPAGLTLRPLPLGSSRNLIVGAPVAAIGSPFGEKQSLSVGVISALDRSIDSLTNFSIAGAIQTDAAINHGNSGGPLINAQGKVLGINSQIRSTGGGGEGVGFAVPIDTVRRSLGQLRRNGKVSYAFIGISSTPVYPQLARRFKLGTDHGAWIQELTAKAPAAKAGLKAGTRTTRFQIQPVRVGGDVIVSVDGHEIRRDTDLSDAIAERNPGQTVTVVYVRDGKRRTASVKLAERPLTTNRQLP